MYPATGLTVNEDVKADAVPILDETDLILVRRMLREYSRAAGLGLVDETKFITAGSELARNIVVHTTAKRGEIRVGRVNATGRRGVKASFIDGGPGILDMNSALTDGFSTAGSLGLGLPGSRRLVDEMTIDSSPESGTVVVITKWRH